MASHLLCALAVRVDGRQTTLHGTLGKDHYLMRIALRTALLSFTLIAAISAPANALEVPIFGNTGLYHQGLDLPTIFPPPPNPNPANFNWLAQGFTMGSTSYQMTSLDLGLRFNNGDFAALEVGLYSSLPNASSTPVATFTSPTLSDGPAIFNFKVVGSQYTLAANATYWVVVKYNPVGDLFTWMFADNQDVPDPQPPVLNQTYTPFAQNSSGISYATNGTQAYNTVTTTWTNYSSSPNYSGLRYTINVPEPSTYALGAIGTLVMGTVARRRTRKIASV